MTRNGFIGLCVLTIAAVALATLSIMRQPSMRSADVAGEPVFPGLAQKLNELKSVEVKQAGSDMIFDFDGKTWVDRDRAGYPADADKLSTLVLQMARLVKIEAKTAAADKLARLDLDDPTAKDSRAKEITLLDKNGKKLADLIVGKRKNTLGSKEGSTYVRLAGSQQGWLAMGDLAPGAQPRDWLKRDIVDIKERDVKRITVTQPDGERIVVGKSAPTDGAFKVENLPAGKQPADNGTDDFGRMLSTMLLDDVSKASDVPFTKDKTVNADIDGFDGFRISLQMTEKNGGTWIKVKAEPPPASAPKPDAAGPDWAKIATDINTRADGWAYQVPPYEVAALRKKMADLIKKPEPKS